MKIIGQLTYHCIVADDDGSECQTSQDPVTDKKKRLNEVNQVALL